MKTWAKLVLGALAALVLVCLLGAGLFFSSGKWDQVKKMTGDTLAMKRNAEGLEALQKEHPFTPPVDGAVPEARLEAWLSVREALKPEADKFNAWAEAHEGEQGDLKDAQEVMGLLSTLMGTTVQALRGAGMSQAEYRFIAKAMAEAEAQAAGRSSGGPLAEEALAVIERASLDPAIPEAQRRALAEDLDRLRARRVPSGEPLTPNAELFVRYAGRIRGSELGEFGESMLQSGRRPRGGVRVEGGTP